VDTRALHHQPCLRPVASLIFFTQGADVRHVVVNGELIVENGRATKPERDKVVADMAQASCALAEKADIIELPAPWRQPRLIRNIMLFYEAYLVTLTMRIKIDGC